MRSQPDYLWQEKRQRKGAPWDKEGKSSQKMETSQLDTTKNGRRVNTRLQGRIITKNLPGRQSEVKEKLGEYIDSDRPKVEIFFRVVMGKRQ